MNKTAPKLPGADMRILSFVPVINCFVIIYLGISYAEKLTLILGGAYFLISLIFSDVSPLIWLVVVIHYIIFYRQIKKKMMEVRKVPSENTTVKQIKNTLQNGATRGPEVLCSPWHGDSSLAGRSRSVIVIKKNGNYQKQQLSTDTSSWCQAQLNLIHIEKMGMIYKVNCNSTGIIIMTGFVIDYTSIRFKNSAEVWNNYCSVKEVKKWTLVIRNILITTWNWKGIFLQRNRI